MRGTWALSHTPVSGCSSTSASLVGCGQLRCQCAGCFAGHVGRSPGPSAQGMTAGRPAIARTPAWRTGAAPATGHAALAPDSEIITDTEVTAAVDPARATQTPAEVDGPDAAYGTGEFPRAARRGPGSTRGARISPRRPGVACSPTTASRSTSA